MVQPSLHRADWEQAFFMIRPISLAAGDVDSNMAIQIAIWSSTWYPLPKPGIN
jgi:hypothetical protein